MSSCICPARPSDPGRQEMVSLVGVHSVLIFTLWTARQQRRPEMLIRSIETTPSGRDTNATTNVSRLAGNRRHACSSNSTRSEIEIKVINFTTLGRYLTPSTTTEKKNNDKPDGTTTRHPDAYSSNRLTRLTRRPNDGTCSSVVSSAVRSEIDRTQSVGTRESGRARVRRM